MDKHNLALLLLLSCFFAFSFLLYKASGNKFDGESSNYEALTRNEDGTAHASMDDETSMVL